MGIDYTLNVWDESLSFLSIVVSSLVAFWIYKLSRQLSANEKYAHELRITDAIRNLPSFATVILADAKKYHTKRLAGGNEIYYKQKAELYCVVQEYGIQVILMPNTDGIPVGLIPFEWVHFIRDNDSEDNKPIIICDFKGVRYFEKFKSPFCEVEYLYLNPNYTEGVDPDNFYLTRIKPIGVSSKVK